MKRTLISGFLGIVFAFAMASCNGNAANNDSVADTTGATMEQTEQCMHHCQMTCPDSLCLAANCENCTCPDSSACRQKPACKGEGNCCKKAEGEGCGNHEGCKKAEGEGCAHHEGCKKAEGQGCANHEGCKKECEKKK